jgi:O-antigen/teichoic acid export membrane protein
MLKIILTIGGIQAVAIVIQFVRSKVVAVLLGPAGVGVVSTIDQIVQFAAFATALSIPLASVKFLSKAHSEGHEAFKKCYAGFFQLLLALALAGTLIAGGLIFLRPQTLGAEVEKYQSYLLVALLSLPTLVLGGFFTNVFAAAQNYRASAALAVITNSATTAAVIVGIFSAGIFGLFIGGSLASIAITLGIVVYLWKKLDLSFLADGTKNLKELWRSPNILSFTAMLYLGSVSYSLSLLVARYAILANFGEVETGLLQGALVLSVAIGMVLNPANGLYLTPIMNRNIEKTEKIGQAVEFQRKMVLILSLVTLPAVMFPQILLAVMFSTKFAAVGNLVFLFVFAQFVTQMGGVHQAILIGFDDLKIYTAIVAGGQIGFAVLSWFLAPVYGIKGIALGGIVSSLAIFFLTFLRLKFTHGFYLPRNLSLLTAYSLSVLLLTGWICSQTDEWDVSATAVKICVFSFFAASLLLFLSKAERLALFGLRHKILFGR